MQLFDWFVYSLVLSSFFIPLTEQTNLLYESVQLSWFNPSQQLSTTQPLAHSSLPPPVGWGGESKTSETRGLR